MESTIGMSHFLFVIVRTEYEVEKLNCKELRKTWELANDHFIASQEKLKEEIHRLHQKLQRGEAVRYLLILSIYNDSDGEYPYIMHHCAMAVVENNYICFILQSNARH